MSEIERSNQQGKFTAAEIRAKVVASKKYWSSPEGIAEKRKQEIAARTRKASPPRFPAIASRAGTRPTLAEWSAKFNKIN
jgi:hypothetical protein